MRDVKKTVAANERGPTRALRGTTITPSDIIVVGSGGRRADGRRIGGRRAHPCPMNDPLNTIIAGDETRRTIPFLVFCIANLARRKVSAKTWLPCDK